MTSPAPAVLVTGASGYVGKLCVKALTARKDSVANIVALDISPVAPAEQLPGVNYLQLDICDPSLASLLRSHNIDTVIHLASILRTPKGAPKDLAYRVDVLGTKNVLEACKSASARKIIVTSSGAAYGYHPDNPAWLDEDHALRGNEEFEYARNKRLVEQMLADWRQSFPQLKQTIFRPGTIVGENVHSPVTDLFEQPFMLGIAGSNSPFVFIWDEDLVACILEAVFNDKPGIFNQAGDGAVTPKEIAHLISKPYLAIPAPALRFILALLKALGMSENGPERVNFLRYRPVLSNRRLKEKFGYTPTHTSLEAFRHYARARGLLGKA